MDGGTNALSLASTSYKIEAEAMTLAGYGVVNSAAASGNKCASARTHGTSTTTFASLTCAQDRRKNGA